MVNHQRLKEFNSKGFTVISGIATEQIIQALSDIYQKEMLESGSLVSCPALKVHPSPSLIDEYLSSTNLYSELKAYACKFLNCASNEITLSTRIFHKSIGSASTLWHQDTAYFKNPAVRLNFWLPLQAVDRENGAMIYIPKSHKLGLLKHKLKADDPSGTTLYLDEIEPSSQYTVILRAGDVVAHHQLTIHSAHQNTKGEARRAITIVANCNRAEQYLG